MTDDTLHDLQLLRRFAEAREEAAFCTLVRLRLGLVLGVAQRILQRHTLAEEVAQDVFALLAARAPALVRGNVILSAWLHRTARYKALLALRTETRRSRNLEKLMHHSESTPAADSSENPLLPHLDAALDSLSEADRQVILLHYYAELPHQEIANQLGVSGEAVRQRSSRAVGRLASALTARSRGAVTIATLTACLGSVLTQPAQAQVAVQIARGAIAAAPAVSKTTLLVNLFYTMSVTKVALSALLVICLVGVAWQEVALASTRGKVNQVQAQSSILPAAGQAKQTAPPQQVSPLWLALQRGELTPDMITELARIIKRVNVDRDTSLIRHLTSLRSVFTPELQLQAFSMALDAGSTISPAERLAFLKYLKPDLLAHAPMDQRVKLMTQAWMTLPAGDRKTFQETAIAQMGVWASKEPAAALAWYRKMAAQGKLSMGLESGEPLTQLAGPLLFTMMIKSAAGAREFLNSLAPECRSDALTTAGWFAGNLPATRNLIPLAKELPPAQSVEPLRRLAIQLAYSESLTAAEELWSTIPFLDATKRAFTAKEIASDYALSKLLRGDAKQKVADGWDWLRKTVPEAGPTVFAEFLANTSWQDPVKTLERFGSLGPAGMAQPVLSAFLENIPGNEPRVAAQYFELATKLTEPTEREDVLGWAIRYYRNADQTAARAALDAAALPSDLKTRVWNARTWPIQ